MATETVDFFLFLGPTDSESATTRLRAHGAIYRKKLLRSKPDNWREIIDLVVSPHNRGTVVALGRGDYEAICTNAYEDVARELLDAFVGRPHVIFVHESVFLTDAQREAADSRHLERRHLVNVTPRFTDEDLFGMPKEELFGSVSDEVRAAVNAMLRERHLNVLPYRTNVERSIMAGSFLDDNERHLLFRLYVPSGRLYAREAETLLGLFRDWLVQTGRSRIRQEGYATNEGQVFEFFSEESLAVATVNDYFQDFSNFLELCVTSADLAVRELKALRLDEHAAARIVARFATQARRLRLDLKQRREENVLALKHQFENLQMEIEGLSSDMIETVIDELLPVPSVNGIALRSSISGHVGLSNVAHQGEVPMPSTGPQASTVNNFHQFINHVAGSVVQSVQGSVNLSADAQQLLELIGQHGVHERSELETAVHELEDEGARAPDRIAARGRLKRFLADLGNRGLTIGLEVLQRYVEHRLGGF